MRFERKTVAHHEDIWCDYDQKRYKTASKDRWDPFKNEPIRDAAALCYIWRKIVNIDCSRLVAVQEIAEKHPKLIIFYNFDYELELLRSLYYGEDVEIAEWNGHKHQEIPESERWICWNYWRKRSKDPILYKLAVLVGVRKSQTMILTIPISLQHRHKR